MQPGVLPLPMSSASFACFLVDCGVVCLATYHWDVFGSFCQQRCVGSAKHLYSCCSQAIRGTVLPLPSTGGNGSTNRDIESDGSEMHSIDNTHQQPHQTPHPLSGRGIMRDDTLE